MMQLLVGIFKQLIDIIFIVVDGVYNFSFSLDGNNNIVLGELLYDCGMVFWILWAIFTLLGLGNSIPDDEEEE